MAAFAQPVPQEAEVHDKLRSLEFPEGVRLRRVNFDTDWSGDNAIYIVFGVSKKIKLTALRVHQLGEFRRAVTNAIDDLNTGYLPYVRFEDVR